MSDLFALFDSPDEGPSTAPAAGKLGGLTLPPPPPRNPTISVGAGGGGAFSKRPIFVSSNPFSGPTVYESLTASLAALSQSETLEGDNAYGCEACTAAARRAAAAERRRRRAYAAAAKPPLLPRAPLRSALGAMPSAGSASAPPPPLAAVADDVGSVAGGRVELARSGLAAAEGGGVDSAAVSMCSGSSGSDGEEDGGSAAAGGGAATGVASGTPAVGPSRDAARSPAAGGARPQQRRDVSPVGVVLSHILPVQLSGVEVATAGSAAAAGALPVEVEGADTSWDGETEGDCGSVHSASAQASSIDGDGSMWRDVPRPSSPTNVSSDAEGVGGPGAGVPRHSGGESGSGISQVDLSPPSPASSASFAGADGAADEADVVGSSPAVKAPVLAAMLHRVPASRAGPGLSVLGPKEAPDAVASGVLRTASALTLRGGEGKDDLGEPLGEPTSGADDPPVEEGGAEEEEEVNVPTVRTRAERRERLQTVPPVLILQLQRFTQTPRGGLRKLSGHVPFPLDLDMTPYMAPHSAYGADGEADRCSVAAGAAAADVPSPPAAQAAARATKKQRKSRPQVAPLAAGADGADGMSGASEDGGGSVASLRSDGCPSWSDSSESAPQVAVAAADGGEQHATQPPLAEAADAPADSPPASPTRRPDGQYTLSGVVVHGGSLYAGHYTCYVRGGEARGGAQCQPGATPTHEWWYCSDSHVSAASEKDVLAAEAYLLFYTARVE